MNPTPEPTVVLVPGLRVHVPDHWQTLLADRIPGAVTVPPPTGAGLARDARVAALNGTLSRSEGPVVLVAHSAGVLTTVQWAARHRHPVRGAPLATPPDFDPRCPTATPARGLCWRTAGCSRGSRTASTSGPNCRTDATACPCPS
ncbi:alpha/beta hydrolase [Streptomyces sp. NPDC005989]|uniref:RBBP9/YdeN family alpha/beta hydrolase n=1 Tax=Streptomyces sp. NPDC005989 TaxID=3156727 RepID=UPI0034048B89